MDPEANLSEQLSLAAEIIEIIDERSNYGVLSEEDKDEVVDNAERLAELVQALDGWLSKGGFLPKRWAADRRGAVLEDIEEDE